MSSSYGAVGPHDPNGRKRGLQFMRYPAEDTRKFFLSWARATAKTQPFWLFFREHFKKNTSIHFVCGACNDRIHSVGGWRNKRYHAAPFGLFSCPLWGLYSYPSSRQIAALAFLFFFNGDDRACKMWALLVPSLHPAACYRRDPMRAGRRRSCPWRRRNAPRGVVS